MLENAIASAPSTPHTRTIRSSASQRSTPPTVDLGRMPNRPALRLSRCPDGVEPAVDVDDLATDPSRQIRQQEADRVGHRPRVLDVPAERGLNPPEIRNVSNPGIPRAATVPKGPAD